MFPSHEAGLVVDALRKACHSSNCTCLSSLKEVNSPNFRFRTYAIPARGRLNRNKLFIGIGRTKHESGTFSVYVGIRIGRSVKNDKGILLQAAIEEKLRNDQNARAISFGGWYGATWELESDEPNWWPFFAFVVENSGVRTDDLTAWATAEHSKFSQQLLTLRNVFPV